MVFITSKTLGVWSSNARLLTVVFFPLVSIGDAFRSFAFCQQEKRGNNSVLESTWKRTTDPRIQSAVTTLGLNNVNAPHICGFSHYLKRRECICLQNCGLIYFSCECSFLLSVDLILFTFLNW